MTEVYTIARQTPQAANGPVGPFRPKTTNRQRNAIAAGDDALRGTRHGIGLLLYYTRLVELCGPRTSCLHSQVELARDAGVVVQTIRRYDAYLVSYGLIRLEKVGHSYSRSIVAYEPKGGAE